MTNDDIIAEFNEADGPEFREAATLASLMDLANDIVGLALDFDVDPEAFAKQIERDTTDPSEYADVLRVALRTVREQIRGTSGGSD